MEGKINWYNKNKGYGFIVGDDQEDYFVHASQVPDDVALTPGSRVSFIVKTTDRGKQAMNVELEEGRWPKTKLQFLYLYLILVF